tara:strand:- start:21 stop:734 length:714 start_codon:yes stop_codon:yes gene_type:complete
MSEDLDFKNWRNFDDATLRRIYGPEKYAENRAAAIHRRNLKTRNFLGGFVSSLFSPVTSALGGMGVPGVTGLGYANPKDSNKVAPQPWIIDEDTGAVIANPALGKVDDYNEAYQESKNYLGSNNPYQLVENDIQARNEASAAIGAQEGIEAITDKVDDFLKNKWLAETANSPAQRSGAWSTPEGKDKLWQQHQMNQAFQEAKKSGTLDDFAAKYPHSQTAKERAIRNRIPTSMDMEF